MVEVGGKEIPVVVATDRLVFLCLSLYEFFEFLLVFPLLLYGLLFGFNFVIFSLFDLSPLLCLSELLFGFNFGPPSLVCWVLSVEKDGGN